MATLTSAWYRAWQSRVQNASLTSLRNKRVLCAFNALIDKTVYYDRQRFSSFFKHFEPHANYIFKKAGLPLHRIDSPDLLAAGLISSFKTGKAMHLPTNFELINWLHSVFPSVEPTIGGQAGIIANQLALIGAKPVLFTPQLSPQLSRLFSPRVHFPVARRNLDFVSIRHAALGKQKPPRTNWIFEYKKGDALTFAGRSFVAPRSNRLILSSPYTIPPVFEDNLVHLLPELGEKLDAGILSGYHALRPIYENGSTYEYYLSLEELYLRMLKAHKYVPLHIEYVSTPFSEIDKAIYEHVTQHVDSFGLNEIEIVELAEKLGHVKQARDVVKSENVVTLHAAAEKIMESLQLKRIHVHNLGYHLVLLKKPVDAHLQKKQVNALLFGSLAATSRALHGREVTRGEIQDALAIELSENALHQMALMASHLSLSRHRAENALLTGIFDVGKHICIVAPAQSAPIIRRTTGLGDTVSSCSFLAGL